MNDFVTTLGLEKLMDKVGVAPPYEDFEKIYSEILANSSLDGVRKEIEEVVYDYFEQLRLPDEPTLYDHLVLSLREKDVVATFNWDPFLWQACHRNYRFAKPPILAFLHGCVAVGKCIACNKVIAAFWPCRTCGRIPEKVPLLFPVEEKNYNADLAIASHWRIIREALKHALVFTIFGYSAPQTDVDAMKLLQEGWGKATDRRFEDVEIIDIRDENALTSSWDAFIHTHHFRVVDNFYNSWIGQHPRRSIEAFYSQTLEVKFIESFTVPTDMSFAELYEWIRPRLVAESPGRNSHHRHSTPPAP